MHRIRLISTNVFLMFLALTLVAQDDNTKVEEWRKTILKSLVSEGFDPIKTDVRIASHHHSDHNNVTHVYFQQYHQGVEVYKSLGNVAFKGKHQILKSSRLVRNFELFEQKKSIVQPEESVYSVAEHLELPLTKSKGKISRIESDTYEMTNLPYAHEKTHIRQVWGKKSDGTYVLSWAVELTPSINNDHWEIIVSGSNGKILNEVNNTVYCKFHEHEDPVYDRGISEAQELPKTPQRTVASKDQKKTEATSVTDGSRYRVFPVPVESPALGERMLIQEPADPEASPFGWHDIDGIAGPEFSTLRGNNVHAYQDSLSANEPPMQEPSSIGGLTFDFPFNPELRPEENLEADLTNLFYWNNFMHDWSFRFGFNETSGNFQAKNYGNLGRDEDEVFAETLDGSDTGNATFSAPRDGTSGRMQMFKWIVGNDFEITTPGNLSGTYTTGNPDFGPTLSTPIEEEIVLVRDNAGAPTDACDPIINADELAGKIAMIDRADCDFSFKVFAAQEAGAVACLICNNVPGEGIVGMRGGENAQLVRIPSLSLSKEDCDLLKPQLAEGLVGRFNETRELSSAFDNGIVVHEYGHGISLRLTGGVSTSACLNNDEQMGEGWSDFLGLVLTQRPEDIPEDSRAIGTYVIGQARTGNGIRRYPYSTDMEINPQLHSHVRFSFRPHDVGEIWTVALWDLYWEFINRDGYDATWKNVDAGNVKMMQLVFDGMKLQECDPGLIEARDAILEADELNNDGSNQCLIWSVFARRGLGTDAISGDTDQRFDNVDGFLTPLSCSGELSISKEMTPLINPGDVINVALNVANFGASLDAAVVTDEIPDGTSLINVEGDIPFTQEGNILSFDIGAFPNGETTVINYELSSDGVDFAEFDVFDNLEGAIQFDRTVTNDDVRGWSLTTAVSFSGIFALRVSPDTLGGESYATRREEFTVTPENQLLKFNHRYDTDLGIDGGVVQVSVDQGTTWTSIAEDKYLVNGFSDKINNCFNNCPVPDFFYRNTEGAFTGTRDWQTTVVDLSEFMGQAVLLRYNYISLTFRDTLSRQGWIVDDFELFERKELAGEACVINDGSRVACVSDFSLINSNAGMTPTTEVITENFSMTVSPNPTSDILNLNLVSKEKFEGSLRFISIDGKTVGNQSISVKIGENSWQRNVGELNSGMYFVELSDRQHQYTLSFIKL